MSFGRHCIAPLLPEIAAAHPELECELILTDDIADLVGDSIDLALRMTRMPPEDAIARKIVNLRRVICASPAYLERHGIPRCPQDLLRHQCLSYVLRDNKAWSLLDESGAEANSTRASPAAELRPQAQGLDALVQRFQPVPPWEQGTSVGLAR